MGLLVGCMGHVVVGCLCRTLLNAAIGWPKELPTNHVLLASLARQSAAACPLRRPEALAFSLRSLGRLFQHAVSSRRHSVTGWGCERGSLPFPAA